jgi:hypothetical protein
LEHDDMASEYHTEQTADERKNPNDSPAPSQPSPQSAPTLLNDGLEPVRSSDC